LAQGVEDDLVLFGFLKPGPGGEEDAHQSTTGEVESLSMGNLVEEAQDGAATGGQR
jgi:hypothetical protein